MTKKATAQKAPLRGRARSKATTTKKTLPKLSERVARKAATKPSKPASKPAIRKRVPPGRALPDLSLWDQAGRLGGKLTPADVSAIIRAADLGEMRPLMDLANECRQKDCHLSAVLSVSEESLAGLQWKLTLPEKAKARDKKAAEWAEKILRALPMLRKLISYLAGAPFYGFDVNEILWKKVEGKLQPIDFAHLSHRRFAYDPYTGAFVLRDEGMPVEGLDFRAKWPNKFIVSHPRANGDSPQREGLCRPLIWMTQFRVWTFSDWLRAAELAWKPWRIGTYNKDRADTTDQADLEHILQKLSSSGWAAKSDAMTIDIEWPSGQQAAKATHSELVNVLAQEMSKCVLGQTETVQASSSSGYGQAKVHDAVRRDIRESRAMQIAADLTRDLIAPMIRLNFGANVAIPQFEFMTQDPVDIKAFSEAVKNLVDAKLVVPAKWVRDNAGMPEPDKDDETIGGETEPAVDPNADAEVDPNDPNAKKPKPKPGKKPADGDENPDAADEDDDADEEEPEAQ